MNVLTHTFRYSEETDDNKGIIHWSRSWSKSPRYAQTHSIDPKILLRSFIKLTKFYPKHLTGLLMCLRTHHAPLNQHLHRISKSLTPSCPHCPNTDENIHHYLLACPHYRKEHHVLTNALGRKASSIPYLLTDESAIPRLTRYVNATGRMKTTFSEVTLLSKCSNWQHPSFRIISPFLIASTHLLPQIIKYPLPYNLQTNQTYSLAYTE